MPSATPVCQTAALMGAAGTAAQTSVFACLGKLEEKAQQHRDFKNIPPRGVSGLIQRLCSSICSISGGIWTERAVWRYEEYWERIKMLFTRYWLDDFLAPGCWNSTLTPGLGEGLSLYGFALLDWNFYICLDIYFFFKKRLFFAADSFSSLYYIISLLCDIRIVLHVLLLRYLHLSKYTAGPGQPSFLL